jgi:hypothetical protein
MRNERGELKRYAKRKHKLKNLENTHSTTLKNGKADDNYIKGMPEQD